MHIRRSQSRDHPHILRIVNEAAEAYRGIIPTDRWKEPYMTDAELTRDIAAGIEFWIAEDGTDLLGVMGIQDRGGVRLVRHAYTTPGQQRRGVGGALLSHIRALGQTPILIGTWAAAQWAIAFYVRHGFALVPGSETPRLLRTYWAIPERQIETSVVLADQHWHARHRTAVE